MRYLFQIIILIITNLHFIVAEQVCMGNGEVIIYNMFAEGVTVKVIPVGSIFNGPKTTIEFDHKYSLRPCFRTPNVFTNWVHVVGGGRISIAALSVGIAQAALDASVKYAKTRKQFGKSLAEFQGIQFKLADMATEIEAARLLTYKAAVMKDEGKDFSFAASLAKYYASEIATKATNEAVQIHGGYGFIKEFPVERYYRDVKLCTIGEGTSEIQKIIMARQLVEQY